MSTEENKALYRRYYEALSQRDYARFDEIFAPTYVYHAPGLPDPVAGPEAFKQLVSGYVAAFPDVQPAIEDLIAEGDKVVARLTYRGTHQGEFQGIAPTGKQISMSSIDIVRIADGKIVEEWESPDNLGLLQQLGVIPTPGQAST